MARKLTGSGEGGKGRSILEKDGTMDMDLRKKWSKTAWEDMT